MAAMLKYMHNTGRCQVPASDPIVVSSAKQQPYSEVSKFECPRELYQKSLKDQITPRIGARICTAVLHYMDHEPFEGHLVRKDGPEVARKLVSARLVHLVRCVSGHSHYKIDDSSVVQGSRQPLTPSRAGRDSCVFGAKHCPWPWKTGCQPLAAPGVRSVRR